MNSVSSSHEAGRAAYTRGASPSQQSAASTPASEKAAESASSSKTQTDTALQKTAESDLSTEEQQMIEENFPEDPELSMKLYGRGRGSKTVRSNSVGGNLDVTG